MKRIVVLILIGLLPVAVVAEPDSARTRLHELQPVAAAEANERAEIRVGRQVAARILSRHELHPDRDLQRYVNLVGTWLSLNGSRPDLTFHFAVIQSEQINAYAAPGGYIFVTSAALEVMEDEVELAGVLAHEIAHVNRRHIVEALDIRAPESSPMAGLTRFFGGASDVAQVFFSQAVDEVVSVLFEQGLQKEDEFDADNHGVRLAGAAGYPVDGLSRFLARLESRESGTEALSETHPPSGERVERMQPILEEVASEAERTQEPAYERRFQRYVQ
jgi:predicted Zn-dependent protease